MRSFCLSHQGLPVQLQLCAQGCTCVPPSSGTPLTSWPRAVGKIVGDVRVNGHPWEVATFARVSGYVEQVLSRLWHPCQSGTCISPRADASTAATPGLPALTCSRVQQTRLST